MTTFVTEQSRKSFRFLFNADDGSLFTPTTVRYRLTDGSGTLLRDWTTLAPAKTVTVTTTATENRILNDSNASEDKIITVQSDFGTDNQLSTEYQYTVLNARGFTS